MLISQQHPQEGSAGRIWGWPSQGWRRKYRVGKRLLVSPSENPVAFTGPVVRPQKHCKGREIPHSYLTRLWLSFHVREVPKSRFRDHRQEILLISLSPKERHIFEVIYLLVMGGKTTSSERILKMNYFIHCQMNAIYHISIQIPYW